MARVQIQANFANLLHYAGSLYRNPMDAVKEYTANAIDAFREASLETREGLSVHYELHKKEVIIRYNAPEMSEREWKEVLARVADSLKRETDKAYIGLRGIGNFAFMQVGHVAEFLHKKSDTSPTIKVVLREGDTKADISSALKREELTERGVRVRIYALKVHDPTSHKSSLSASRLSRYLAEKFDAFLRDGWLTITISSGKNHITVKPLAINLPMIGTEYQKLYASVNGNEHMIRTKLWFDPSGKSVVKIRHNGVPIVDDMSILENGFGVEHSIFASGSVHGYLDVDFLEPLPTRNGFEEGEAWYQFLEIVQRVAPALEAEVALLADIAQQNRTAEIQKQAIQIARELLLAPELQSLDWFGPGAKIPQGSRTHTNADGRKRTPTPTGERSNTPSETPGGKRIAFQIEPFPEGPYLHSSSVIGENAVIRVNSNNPDFIAMQSGSEKAQTYYFARLISKELIEYNDKTGLSNESLEHALSAEFRLRHMLHM